MSEYYTEYSHEQLSKIGNTVIYLAEKIPSISKTKVLKLLYILDELSIRKSGIPFINLKYKVWKFGPVSEDMFIDLSTEPTLLKNYISRETKNDGNTYILPLRAFEDDEFSENDLSLLDYVISEFGNQTAQQLVSYTHRKQSPWHNTAVEKDILDLLENEKISNTEYVINMQMLIQHDENKLQIYREYLESN